MSEIILNRFWAKYGISPSIYVLSLAIVFFIILSNAAYIRFKYKDFNLYMLDKGVLIICGYILLTTTAGLIVHYIRFWNK